MQDVPTLLKKAAESLLRWRGTDQLGAKDVLAWVRKDGYWGLALQGPALRLENRVLRQDFPLNNRGLQVDLSLQRSFGYDASVQRTKFFWDFKGGLGQQMSDGRVSWDEIQPAIEAVASSACGDRGVFVTLMPMQGAPWNPGTSCTPYYSAKKRKVMCGRKPEGTIRLPNGDLGIDMCTIAPLVKETSGGIVGSFTDDDFFFVTHCFNVASVRPSPAKAAASIKKCGGLLYPSLAISDVPSALFGPCVLFARIPVVMRHLAPYKKASPGKPWPVTIYSTDAWTGVTGDYVGSEAKNLFEQLTGSGDVNESHDHMAILGPKVETVAGGFGGHYEAKIVKSTKQLRSKLNKKRKHWVRGKSPQEVREAVGEDGELRYSFLEAKVNGVLSVDETFPLAVCPTYLRSKTAKFLDGIGFTGQLVTLKVPEGIKAAQTGKVSDLSRGLEWTYAWMVRERALEWQEIQGSAWREFIEEADHGMLGKYSPLFNEVKL